MDCPVCQAANRPNAQFCCKCGESLPAPAPLSALVTQRRGISLRLLALLTLLLAIVGSCGVLAFSPAAQRLGGLGGWLSSITGKPTVASVDTVVQGMQGMSQLATAKYTIQTVVEVEDRGALGGLTADRILLRANADVLAGIDLGAIKAEQVQPQGDSVTITLPPPTLISKDITFQVYDRKRGWFAPNNKDLQTMAEDKARSEIVATACDKGILKEAQANAESTLRTFLLSLGYKQATFVATAADAGSCKV